MAYVRERVYPNGKVIRLQLQTGGVWDIQDGQPRASTLPARTLAEVRLAADKVAGEAAQSDVLLADQVAEGDAGPCEFDGCPGSMSYAGESDPAIGGTSVGNRRQDAIVGRCDLDDSHVHTARVTLIS